MDKYTSTGNLNSTKTIYQALVAMIMKYLFLMMADITANILIFPFALLTGWLLFEGVFHNGYWIITRDFGDMQWMAAWALSGYVSLSILYYLIQWPITLVLKLKAASSSELDRGRFVQYLWWMGGVISVSTGGAPKRTAFLAFVVHTAAIYLRFYGVMAFFACIGAAIASADYSPLDMASLIPFAVVEIVKAVG